MSKIQNTGNKISLECVKTGTPRMLMITQNSTLLLEDSSTVPCFRKYNLSV